MDFREIIISFLGIQDVVIEDIKRFKKELRLLATYRFGELRLICPLGFVSCDLCLYKGLVVIEFKYRHCEFTNIKLLVHLINILTLWRHFLMSRTAFSNAAIFCGRYGKLL